METSFPPYTLQVPGYVEALGIVEADISRYQMSFLSGCHPINTVKKVLKGNLGFVQNIIHSSTLDGAVLATHQLENVLLR